MKDPNTKLADLFFFQVAADYGFGYVEVKYKFSSSFPLIILKHFDRGLMNVLVRIHLFMTYHQNETLKAVSDLIVSNVTLAIDIFSNLFQSCFCYS